MTDTFALEVAEPVIEIGHYELRGFRGHQAVYALCQEGEQPCRPKPPLARVMYYSGLVGEQGSIKPGGRRAGDAERQSMVGLLTCRMG
jgi:hypothetical protein